MAAVKIGDSGSIDTTGQVVIQPKLATIADFFREGVGMVQLDSRDVLIDTLGAILATEFGLGDLVSEVTSQATPRRKEWLSYLQGNVVHPSIVYDSGQSFSDGLAQ